MIVFALILALLAGVALFGWGLFLEMATQYQAEGPQGAWQIVLGMVLFLLGAVGLVAKVIIAIARTL